MKRNGGGMIDFTLPFESALSGKRVFVTGHTGFTGSWASLWLAAIGAEVHGYSLPPDTEPALFCEAKIESLLTTNYYGDVADLEGLTRQVKRVEPDLILHLAAQPLVRLSYREPHKTFLVNTMGTVNVLEAARCTGSVKGVLCITTDKVYKNREWPWPYRECDELGGKDPYSASKAAAELVIAGYIHSFFNAGEQGPAIAIARGGNIIGGGDWSADRLVPDFVRAVTNKTTITLRYPQATRPWQHVLALVQGYLQVLAGLIGENKTHYARPWNLGPVDHRVYAVCDVMQMLSDAWVAPDIIYTESSLHEAASLSLDCTLAIHELLWNVPWDTLRSVNETATWYKGYYDGLDAQKLTESQLRMWRASLKNL